MTSTKKPALLSKIAEAIEAAHKTGIDHISADSVMELSQMLMQYSITRAPLEKNVLGAIVRQSLLEEADATLSFREKSGRITTTIVNTDSSFIHIISFPNSTRFAQIEASDLAVSNSQIGEAFRSALNSMALFSDIAKPIGNNDNGGSSDQDDESTSPNYKEMTIAQLTAELEMGKDDEQQVLCDNRNEWVVVNSSDSIDFD